MCPGKTNVSTGTPRRRFNTSKVSSLLEEMDDTDRKLLYLMYEDPRMPLREISRRLGVSRQTANHRLKVLVRMGVFKNLRAVVSFDYRGGFLVAIWGRSNSTSVAGCLDRLGECRLTYHVYVLGGNVLFVEGGLTKMSDLDNYVRFVKDAAEMPDPIIGILCYGDGINPMHAAQTKENFVTLSPLDLKMMAMLQDDARRPIAEIADAIGVSAKTVRKHLTRMYSEGSMLFDWLWDLTSGEAMVTLLFVKLRGGADKVKFARRLLSKDPVHLICPTSFSNIPGLLIIYLSSEHMNEIRKILRGIAEDEDVLTVTPNLIYDERMYWAKDMRATGAVIRSYEKARKKDRSVRWAAHSSVLSQKLEEREDD